MARAPQVLGVGHTSWDHQFSIQAFPPTATKIAAQRYSSSTGGMTANACVAAARLGAQVRIASPVGADDVPWFGAYFAKEGVDASAVVGVPHADSSVSAVMVDALGQRLIVSHRGSALHQAPAFDTSLVDGTEVLLTDPRCVLWAEAALKRARQLQRVSILDADAAPTEDLQRLVGLSQWAVFSQAGLAAFAAGASTRQGLAAALDAGAEVAVVTRDEQPLWWQRRGGQAQEMAGFSVRPVVDTTAAGDTFHGALAVALGEGFDDRRALRFAAAAAALKCLQPGGVMGAPRRAQVDAFLASQA